MINSRIRSASIYKLYPNGVSVNTSAGRLRTQPELQEHQFSCPEPSCDVQRTSEMDVR